MFVAAVFAGVLRGLKRVLDPLGPADQAVAEEVVGKETVVPRLWRPAPCRKEEAG